MRVAIDLRPLQMGHQNRGIGNYLLNIIKYFPTDNEKYEYIFLRYDSSNPIIEYGIGKGRKYEEIVYKKVKYTRKPVGLYNFATSFLKPNYLRLRLKRPDVFFQPDYLLRTPRCSRIKSVIVAYDLIPLIFKNMYLPSWKKYWHLKQIRFRGRVKLAIRAKYYENKYNLAIKSMRRASTIISISQSTTNDLVKIAKVKRSKIHTIHLAPSFVENVESSNSHDVNNLVNNIKGKYLLFIGGTDSRRKADELVYAYNLLRSRGLEFALVFAGNEFVKNSPELNHKTKKSIESSSYKKDIYMLGKISSKEKRLLLSKAFAFVYPTLYEGFGLPILEAMDAGCPVITFDSPAVKEIGGNAALYTETMDGVGIYNSVLKINDNTKLRQKVVDLGKKQASSFTWDKTGQETASLIFNTR